MAVPVTVTVVPACTEEPAAGEAMVDVGGCVSVEAEAATRPGCNVAGCAPMSANRLTVACSMFRSGVDGWTELLPSKAYAQPIVPAPNTRAPLDARYIVRLWVAGPGA